MPYNSERHHRRSIRLKGYDYSAEGSYFVTICVKDRECVLGEIVEADMHLSAIGEIIRQCWAALADDLPNVMLDGYQVMPNHFHGIVVLFEHRRDLIGRDLINQIPTGNIPTGVDDSRFGPTLAWRQMENPKQTLGKVIRHFKAKATKRIHDAGFGSFQWQSRFYDRIIRNEEELDRIRDYIQENPRNWRDDDENSNRVG